MTDTIQVEVDSPMPEWTVVLVGGNEDVYQQMRRKLAGVNITVGAWWEGPRDVQTRVPDRCNGLLVLKDFVSHTLADKAKECADRTGVRWAYITRKWSQTMVALAATGFIPPAVGLASPSSGSGRPSKVGNKLVRSFVSQATGKRVTVEQGGRVFAAMQSVTSAEARAMGDLPFASFVAAALHGESKSSPEVTQQVTTEVTAQEEPAMSKPSLSVNVQTIPISPSRPSRADLIEALKITALELMTAHSVVDIRISEAEGIQIKVMEQLNVKL